MISRVSITSLACVAALLLPASLSGQKGNMSDATGATVGLFSRVMVRAFAAPPAPPPVLVASREMLDAMCVERADAMLVYAALSGEASDPARRTAVTLLRGGAGTTRSAQRMEAALVSGGAASDESERLVRATVGLLSPARPEVPDVATAVSHYNEFVEAAPLTFLADPPAEFLALRQALGRLTAAANSSYATERVYPDLPPADVHYADGAAWMLAGDPLHMYDEVYLQFGNPVAVGARRFRRLGSYEGVWVLSEIPVSDPPTTVYVPLRISCDIVLQPYELAEPIIKDEKAIR